MTYTVTKMTNMELLKKSLQDIAGQPGLSFNFAHCSFGLGKYV